MSKRKFSAEFKVRFVLEGLKSPDGVAAHCRRQGISEQQFYKWQQQMLSNADALFEQVPQKAARKIQTLEEEIKRKDSIIAAVTEEALELKKAYQLARYKRLSVDVKLDMIDMIHRYRSYGWSKRAICLKWGICAKTLHEVEGCRALRKSPDRQALNAITPAEKRAVVNYALEHTELNHREMAYRMIDENIAFMSPSSVYRILRERNLLAIRESKPKGDQWDPHQYPGKANEIWQTDLMIIRYRGADFFLLSYIDVFSRFIPYHELLTSMTGDTIKEATRRALLCCPECPANIQSDNGSGFISVEYRSYLSKNDIQHRRIHPYCPNENAEVERYHRTLRELIDPDDAGDFDQLIQLVKDRIDYYNNTRYHSAIGFVTPHSKYTGKADQIIQERERKLARAREQRKQQNLSLMKNKAA